jgi:hypothetical protein
MQESEVAAIPYSDRPLAEMKRLSLPILTHASVLSDRYGTTHTQGRHCVGGFGA